MRVWSVKVMETVGIKGHCVMLKRDNKIPEDETD